MQEEHSAGEVSAPTFNEALTVWAKIGVLSFGGPAGQIALMHKMLVDEKKWLDESRFLHALNFCMLLPGPEAMQLATYAGWRLHGVKGGLAAGLLFVIPGALVVLALSMIYAAIGKLPVAEALLLGVKAAVLAIVVEALLKVAKRALKTRLDWWIAGVAFVAIFLLGVPFPLIVLTAAMLGLLRGLSAEAVPVAEAAAAPSVPITQTLRTILVWLVIWAIPFVLILLLAGRGHVLFDIALFFSKLAVVTFGGAYAVLAYMAQEVVQRFGWLDAGEMVDALGLAETTPGPLILVTEFVGYLTANRHGGGTPWLMGIGGAVVTLWVTFAPCFLWIFAGAPYVERLHAEPRLKAALAAVTAAVVGVILNLTVWFALHVLFARVDDTRVGWLKLHVPDITSLRPLALALGILAMVMLFAWHRGIILTLAVCAGVAFAWHGFTG